MWFCDKDIEKLSLQLKSRCCRSEYCQTAKSCSDVQRLQRPQNFWHKVRCSLSVNSSHAFYFSDAKHIILRSCIAAITFSVLPMQRQQKIGDHLMLIRRLWSNAHSNACFGVKQLRRFKCLQTFPFMTFPSTKFMHHCPVLVICSFHCWYISIAISEFDEFFALKDPWITFIKYEHVKWIELEFPCIFHYGIYCRSAILF